MNRATYDVRAERKGRWWLLEAPDAPGAVSQVRNLSQADAFMREAIAFVLDVPADSFDITVTPVLPRKVANNVQQARKATRELVDMQARAAKLSRQAVKDLADAGLSGTDTATVLHISPQRVSQLVADVTRAEIARTSSGRTAAAVESRKQAVIDQISRVSR